jgi:putative multiple sugar transport system ATP-binding protein
MEHILEMRNIGKEFSGVTALSSVNLEVEKGEIHGLIGENGAGKSTLMNVLSGVYPHGSYTGKIFFEGRECKFSNIKQSENTGIVIIHQELALVQHMSIAENIFLGNEIKDKFGVINWHKTTSRAMELLELVGLQESPDTLIRDIGVGKQQLVEIAKAFGKNVKLLILDEPTASLNEEDSKNILDLLLKFKKDGHTSIIISHKLNEIEYATDNITILRDGSTVETIPTFDEDRNRVKEYRLIKGMVGREIKDRFPGRDTKIEGKVFEVKHWEATHPLYNRKIVNGISMYARKGEIVGISGLMGAGRSEFAMSLFGGLYGRDIKGDLFLNGKAIKLKNVSDAIKNKIAYVTEDRKQSGLILDDTIKMNITLANLKKISRKGIINNYKEREDAHDFNEILKVKSEGIEQNPKSLSGGNQQKILLAKWLYTDPEILILDEPTRGIDVGAKYEIYQFMNKLASEGKAIIMISSEMPELLGMSDRVYVINKGKIVGEFTKDEVNQEKIMSTILNCH